VVAGSRDHDDVRIEAVDRGREDEGRLVVLGVAGHRQVQHVQSAAT
jgi:hypothetical protein